MHVGITQNLITEVRDRINDELKPKDYRLNFGVDDVDKTFQLPFDHPILDTIIWGEHLPLRGLIPAYWCGKLETDYRKERAIHFSTKNPRDNDELTVEVSIVGKGEVILPPLTDKFRPTFGVKYKAFNELKEFFDKKIQEFEFEKKWCKISTDVRDFLRSNKSLNSALKAWPEVRAFIPTEYLERVDRKVDRKASREVAERKLAEIDRDGAVAAATIAALAA